ncbi:MAG: uracil-DNA glycosylase [Pseudomonadota bacterium]
MTDQTALAMLQWQIELGATEAICETPIDRYSEPAVAPKLKLTPNSNIQPVTEMPAIVEQSAPEVATLLAAKCDSLDALRNAIGTFELCALKKGARHTVFSDGQPSARVMVIGEAPGREEDRQGKPFVGEAGQLLDKMFGAIGMGRDHMGDTALYITNVMPWRPPQNRDPSLDEIQMMMPFLKRHIELVDPELLVLMGNTACNAVLGRTGITRLRGHWQDFMGRPVMPMFHPAFLLRDASRKKAAWEDLQTIQARLGDS